MSIMDKQPYESPRTRLIALRFERVFLTPSNELPPADEFDGGDY